MPVSVAELIADLNPERPETVAALDARGFLVCDAEDIEAYRTRIRGILSAGEALGHELAENGEARLFEMFTVVPGDAIPGELMDEAAEATWSLYRFSIDWVPGFFLRQGIGLLWGGCAVTDPETFASVFLIRHNFARRARWFIYRRQELMAHELCHVARMVLDDRPYEEHFAYATATSRLRRYMGNWFQTKADAILFLLPVMVLLVAELVRTFGGLNYPIWPFWLLALSYPLWLMGRNQWQRIVFFRALMALASCGCRYPRALLFRCNSLEIATIAGFFRRPAESLNEWLRQRAEESLQWRVMVYRFIDHAGEDESLAPDGPELNLEADRS